MSEVLFIYKIKELLKTFEKTQDDFLIKYIRIYDCELDYLIRTDRFKNLFRIDLINCCGIRTDNELKTVLLPKTIIGVDNKIRSGLFDLYSTDSLGSICYRNIPMRNGIGIFRSFDILFNIIIETKKDDLKDIQLFSDNCCLNISNVIRISENKYLLCLFPINLLPLMGSTYIIKLGFEAEVYIEGLYLNDKLREIFNNKTFCPELFSDKNGLINSFFKKFYSNQSSLLNKKEGYCGFYFILNHLNYCDIKKYKLKKVGINFGSINNYNLENFGKGLFTISKE